MEQLIELFGEGNGRIGKTGLAAAIKAGALVLGADGLVTVDMKVLALL